MQLTLVRRSGPIPAVAASAALRPITAGDLDDVGTLYAHCHPVEDVGEEADAIADVRASWDGEYGRWLPEASLVAEIDGALAGAILTVEHPPWPDVQHLVFIIDCFVGPDWRGHGVGAALIAGALARVGDRCVGLRVESDNLPAVRLYARFGFVPMGADRAHS